MEKKVKINKMSFNMSSAIMNDKNLAILSVNGAQNDKGKKCNHSCNFKVLCYTPKNSTGIVSLTKNSNTIKKTITTDQDLVIIPSNAIIDSVEFFGVDGFSTKGSFNIGLGQLNDSILMPLIENTDSTIANEKVGGCRQFISNAANGKNNKNLVLFDSNINISLENPITSGYLQIVISYHMKPV